MGKLHVNFHFLKGFMEEIPLKLWNWTNLMIFFYVLKRACNIFKVIASTTLNNGYKCNTNGK